MLIKSEQALTRIQFLCYARIVNFNVNKVVASAPAYPHGVVDDVTAIGKICSEHNVGLHVDACLGGFILPWARRAGFDIPQFDFTVQGVTSISCDTHKVYCFLVLILTQLVWVCTKRHFCSLVQHTRAKELCIFH